MPIAKEDLFDGFTVVARKGTYISNSAVAAGGFEDKVEPGEDPDPAAGNSQAEPPTSEVPPQSGQAPQAG